MLELVDPCSGLVQPAEGHQQLIIIVLADHRRDPYDDELARRW